MTEIRCVKCNARLFDVEYGAIIKGLVIKCRKCSYKNKVEIAESIVLPHAIPTNGKINLFNFKTEEYEIGKKVVLK